MTNDIHLSQLFILKPKTSNVVVKGHLSFAALILDLQTSAKPPPGPFSLGHDSNPSVILRHVPAAILSSGVTRPGLCKESQSRYQLSCHEWLTFCLVAGDHRPAWH